MKWTDKKTWAFILVFLVVMGGVWVWSNQLLKTEYRVGESVKFRIDSAVQICTNQLPYTIIKPNGESVKLQHSCSGFMGAGFDQYCKDGKVVTKRAGSCSDTISCYNKSIHETFTWDQKEYVEIVEKCGNKTIHREVKKQVQPGEYRIVAGENVIKKFYIKDIKR